MPAWQSPDVHTYRRVILPSQLIQTGLRAFIAQPGFPGWIACRVLATTLLWNKMIMADTALGFVMLPLLPFAQRWVVRVHH
jgi:hypothetical protein